MKIGTFVLLVLAVLAGGWLWLFFPHYIDQVKMADCAGQAAATWASFNDEGRARRKFEAQTKSRDLPGTLGIELCDFEHPPGRFVVNCHWTVDVRIPVVDVWRRLSFQARESATPDGHLE